MYKEMPAFRAFKHVLRVTHRVSASRGRVTYRAVPVPTVVAWLRMAGMAAGTNGSGQTVETCQRQSSVIGEPAVVAFPYQPESTIWKLATLLIHRPLPSEASLLTSPATHPPPGSSPTASSLLALAPGISAVSFGYRLVVLNFVIAAHPGLSRRCDTSCLSSGLPGSRPGRVPSMIHPTKHSTFWGWLSPKLSWTGRREARALTKIT
ncbi:hypothetical protein BGZ61DRAFT_170868 [Ilyonectria robusta]|uniref:uncharacterized protein n=1 Tax=Ilyonectria robusta TaxID=1079257 RepID=UPI001E8E357D|nr:uncharacterized protein BGZ61DRAFT_170868 [Ilyonectria robusta]KAH8659550.1 hypothetical protein BGZ61DRAFT_170868 [Ilyonectria robusta]